MATPQQAPAPAPNVCYQNSDDGPARDAAPIHPGDPGWDPEFDRNHYGRLRKLSGPRVDDRQLKAAQTSLKLPVNWKSVVRPFLLTTKDTLPVV